MSNDKAEVITPVGRVVFIKNLFTPTQNNQGKDRYKAALIIDNDKDVTKIQKMLKDAAHAKWGDKLPNGLKMGLKKETREDFLESYPYMKNAWVLNSSNGYQVPVIKYPTNEEMFEGDIKAGDQARFNISAFAFENKENKGVSLNVLGVQFIREDEAFYARANATDMFASAEQLEGAVKKEEVESAPAEDFSW